MAPELLSSQAASDDILYSGPATLYLPVRPGPPRLPAWLLGRTKPGLGGVLRVTTEDLVFRPHLVNVSREVTRIPVADVTGMRKTRRLLSLLLVLSLSDGSQVEVLSWNRDRIIDAVHRAQRRGKRAS